MRWDSNICGEPRVRACCCCACRGEGVLAYCGGEYNSGGMGPPTPLDSDCDGVPDDRDVCRQLQGLESNAGCPAGIEVVVVTGLPSGVLCPNGLRAASKSHCPGYSLWRNSHTTLPYDSRTHQVSSSDGAAPCGSTVDAGCACGAGKVKVFDEDNDTFHCKPAPPDEGCPNWDQTFDFDLRVWSCATRPLDADPKKLAERVKNCGAPTVKKYWDHSMILAINYGFSSGQPDRYGGVGCHPDREEPPRHVNEPPEGITVTYFRSALENAGDPYSSDWHWAALAPIHENIHVDDFIRFNSCAPWETLEGINALRDEAGYTDRDFNEEGFEKWTRKRADAEYFSTFGVLSPEDPDHRTAVDNKPLSCLFEE